MADKHVMFISASVGAGHNQASAAIMAGLHARAPSVSVEFIDTMEYVPAWFRCAYSGGYGVMVTRFPRLYGIGYRLQNRPQTPRREIGERLRLAIEWRALKRFRNRLMQHKPTLIVATHYLATPMIGRLIRGGETGLRMMAVVTDNEAHRFWYAENVEKWFVSNQSVGDELRKWDIEPKRIAVSGIPVHPKWTTQTDRAEVLRKWSLPADRPIVLLSGGTYFTIGPIGRIARAIINETNAHVIVLAGANKKLLASLAQMPEAQSRMTPVPMTDRLNELASVAEVMVTKPGGLTTSECLAGGTAMVLTKPVPRTGGSQRRYACRAGCSRGRPDE